MQKVGKLLASGTAEECVETLGYASLHSFYSMISRTDSGNSKKYIVEH